jgi:hypothetical protein
MQSFDYVSVIRYHFSGSWISKVGASLNVAVVVNNFLFTCATERFLR